MNLYRYFFTLSVSPSSLTMNFIKYFALAVSKALIYCSLNLGMFPFPYLTKQEFLALEGPCYFIEII